MKIPTDIPVRASRAALRAPQIAAPSPENLSSGLTEFSNALGTVSDRLLLEERRVQVTDAETAARAEIKALSNNPDAFFAEPKGPTVDNGPISRSEADFSTANAAYQTQVAAIVQKHAGGISHGATRRVFENRLRGFTDSQISSFQTATKGRIADRNRASIATSLDGLANQAVDATPEELSTLLSRGSDLISGATDGTLNEVQKKDLADKFTRRMIGIRIVEKLQDDPAAVLAMTDDDPLFGLLPPEERMAYRAKAERQSAHVQAVKTARQAQLVTDDLMSRNLSERQALSEARKVEDPKMRDDIVRRLKVRYSELKRLEDEGLREAKANAVALAREGRFEEIEPNVMASLPVTFQETLAKISERVARGSAIVSDAVTINRLNRMSEAEFLAVELLDDEYVGGLDVTDWERFSNLQGKLQRGAKDTDRVAGRTRTQILRATVDSINLNDEKEALLGRRFDEELAAYVEANEKNPSSIEMQAMMDRLVIQGEAVGSGFFGLVDNDMRLFEAEPGQVFEINDAKEVPTGFVAAFEHHRGRRPDEDELVDTYNQFLAQQRGTQPVGEEPEDLELEEIGDSPSDRRIR